MYSCNEGSCDSWVVVFLLTNIVVFLSSNIKHFGRTVILNRWYKNETTPKCNKLAWITETLQDYSFKSITFI